jgi:hypothetical protein
VTGLPSSSVRSPSTWKSSTASSSGIGSTSGAEADGVLELLLVGDPRDLEDAHADPVARDAEANALARKPVLAEEGTENVREQLGLAQLAADDEAGVELGARDLDELGTPLLTTRAAASWEAPILSRRGACPLRPGRRLPSSLGLLAAFSRRGSFGLRLNERSRFRSGCCPSSPSSPSAQVPRRPRPRLRLPLRHQIRELDLLLQVDHRLCLRRDPQALVRLLPVALGSSKPERSRRPSSCSGRLAAAERGLDGDHAPRGSALRADCSIVCMPLAVPVCMTE